MRRKIADGMRYGQRGGDGPTRGKTARTFEAVNPETGATMRKRVFKLDGDGPFVMVAYRHQGVIHANTVFREAAMPEWAQRSEIKLSAVEIAND